MKANRFIIVGIALSVLMSAASLAWQAKESAPFAKFFRPLNASTITEAEFRSLKVEFQLLRSQTPPLNGIYPPELNFSSVDRSLTILVPVVSESLPANYDERKKTFNETVELCHAMVGYEFGYPPDGTYVIEFRDTKKALMATAKAIKSNQKLPPDTGLVAEYKNGKLTMR